MTRCFLARMCRGRLAPSRFTTPAWLGRATRCWRRRASDSRGGAHRRRAGGRGSRGRPGPRWGRLTFVVPSGIACPPKVARRVLGLAPRRLRPERTRSPALASSRRRARASFHGSIPFQRSCSPCRPAIRWSSAASSWSSSHRVTWSSPSQWASTIRLKGFTHCPNQAASASVSSCAHLVAAAGEHSSQSIAYRSWMSSHVVMVVVIGCAAASRVQGVPPLRTAGGLHAADRRDVADSVEHVLGTSSSIAGRCGGCRRPPAGPDPGRLWLRIAISARSVNGPGGCR